jgi:hypothetical protein
MDEPAENDIDAFIDRWQHADGTTSSGYIDLYRRGAFICEAKPDQQGTAQQGLGQRHAAGLLLAAGAGQPIERVIGP